MARHAAFVCCALFLCLCCQPAVWAADAPHDLAGISLGEKASRTKGRVRLNKQRSVPDAPYLRRLAVAPDKYFSGGYVLVGTCAAPGRILRIKMRYRDNSLEFFRKISGEMLARYGDPAEYKGEIDGRIMGNKWSFSDPWLRPVSLILQRVDGEDPETRRGNTIKLTNWGMLETERACWHERHGTPSPTPAGKKSRDDGYLPR